LYESVPPQWYGGTERVVAWLTEELVAMGHEVTLFASGDSRTSARLVSACPRALRLDTDCEDPLPYHILQLEQVFDEASEFDLIHFHVDYLHYSLAQRQAVPCVTTLHGRLDLRDRMPLFRTFRQSPVVSISDSQRAPVPWLNWQATVHHGLPADLHTFREQLGKYLLFLGRISPEKGIEQAIEIARRSGMPLIVAAKVDRIDQEYFDTNVKHLLNTPGVEYIGEVGGRDKDEILGGAHALLFPINWEEPFGLVMIESMACGTPVIAYPRGSVPEVIDDGVTGFLVQGVDDAVLAVERVANLSRRECRRRFEHRFTANRMAKDYLNVYQRVASRRRRALTA
jgi:glycosyltransferase involved in cell wall biosynthesis